MLEDEEVVEIMATRVEEVGEVVEITIDSGAGRSVWPKSKRAVGMLMPLKNKVKLVAANGTDIAVYGKTCPV